MDQLFQLETLKTLLVTMTLILWFYWLWTRRTLYRFALVYPGKLGSPLLGAFHRITHLKYLIPSFSEMFEECKRHTICIWMGLYPVLLTADPEIIEKVISSNELLNKAIPMYNSLHDVFDGGIVASPAPKWRHNRKLINPTFRHKVLVSFLPVFHKAKNLTLKKLDLLVGKGEQELADMLQRISLGITVETTMGKVMKENDEMSEDISLKYAFMMEKTAMQILFSFLNLKWIYTLYYRFRKTKKYLHKFVDELIIQKIKTLEESKEIENSKESCHESQDLVADMKKAPTNFIDQAIQMYQQQKLTWNDIIAESNTIVAAAFETTANTIYSAIVLLAMHPQVQDKLYEEILNIFPDKDFQWEYGHMEQTPYLDMVINETLRVTPSVPLIGRHVMQDLQLTKDLLLPKNLQIMISLFHLHRRTDIWGPKANEFNPDNFLPENMVDKHPYAFIPFSKGIRNCIGWRYALFAMKVMLTGLVRNYRYSTTFKYEDLRFVNNIAMKYLVEPHIEIFRR